MELEKSPSQRLVRILQKECAPSMSPACLRQQGRPSSENVGAFLNVGGFAKLFVPLRVEFEDFGILSSRVLVQLRENARQVKSLEKAVVTGINGGHVHVASTDCPPWRPLFQTYYLDVDALVLMLDISADRTPSEPVKFESAIAQDVEGVRNFLNKFDDWETCPLLILCHATGIESGSFDAERIQGEIGKCELRHLPNRDWVFLMILQFSYHIFGI